MGLFDDFLNDSVSASQVAQNTISGVYGSDGGGPGGFSLSSGLQSLLGLGMTYAQGVASIDLSKRAIAVQQAAQQPVLMGTQSPIYSDLTSRGVGALGSMKVGNLLPFVGLGVVVAFVVLGSD